MAEIDNDELEFETLAKCSKALSKLDDETKKRVIHYLLIKYNLINIGDTFGFCINLGGNSIPISTRCTASWLLAPLAWLC